MQIFDRFRIGSYDEQRPPIVQPHVGPHLQHPMPIADPFAMNAFHQARSCQFQLESALKVPVPGSPIVHEWK